MLGRRCGAYRLLRLKFVAQGPGGNTFVVDQAEHLTVTPDGTIVVDQLKPIAARC